MSGGSPPVQFFILFNMALGNRIQTVDKLMAILQTVKDKTGGDTKIRFWDADHYADINDTDECKEYIEDARLRGELDLLETQNSSDGNTYLYLGIGG